MDYFAGLDVSVKATSVCIVDDTSKIVREVTAWRVVILDQWSKMHGSTFKALRWLLASDKTRERDGTMVRAGAELAQAP